MSETSCSDTVIRQLTEEIIRCLNLFNVSRKILTTLRFFQHFPKIRVGLTISQLRNMHQLRWVQADFFAKHTVFRSRAILRFVPQFAEAVAQIKPIRPLTTPSLLPIPQAHVATRRHNSLPYSAIDPFNLISRYLEQLIQSSGVHLVCGQFLCSAVLFGDEHSSVSVSDERHQTPILWHLGLSSQL